MTLVDVMGWLAVALTLLTFSMSKMISLRCIAICSNAAFILFGSLSGIMPVLVLHLLLLPCNILRLYQLWVDRVQLNGSILRSVRERVSSDQDRGCDPSWDQSHGYSIIFAGPPRLGEVRMLVPLNVDL